MNSPPKIPCFAELTRSYQAGNFPKSEKNLVFWGLVAFALTCISDTRTGVEASLFRDVQYTPQLLILLDESL